MTGPHPTTVRFLGAGAARAKVAAQLVAGFRARPPRDPDRRPAAAVLHRRTRSCSPRSSATPPRISRATRQHVAPRVRDARRRWRRSTRAAAGAQVVRETGLLLGDLGDQPAGRRPVRRAVVRRHAARVLTAAILFARGRVRDAAADLARLAGRDGARSRPGAGRRPLRDPPAARRVRAAARTGAATGRGATPRPRPVGQFPRRRVFAARSRSTCRCSSSGSRPVTTQIQVPNPWDELARGYFSCFLHGPWSIGEFKRRLPAAQQGALGHGRALPGPTGPGASIAGGSSLVVFRRAAHPREGLAADRVPVAAGDPAQVLRADRATCPPRRTSWDDPRLADEHVRAFPRFSSERLRRTPPVPEWERIATEMARGLRRRAARQVSPATTAAELAAVVDAAATELDAHADQILEKAAVDPRPTGRSTRPAVTARPGAAVVVVRVAPR